MSTKSTESLCPSCKYSCMPNDIFCGNCGYRVVRPNDKTIIVSRQDKSSTDTLSRQQASIIFYLITTVGICVLVGIVLNGLGMLLPSIISIGSSASSVIFVVSGAAGAILEKKVIPAGIWKNANRLIAVLASLLTTALLTAACLFMSFNQNNPSIQIGKLLLNDPLSNNSKGYNWEVDNDGPGTCYFVAGAYHAIQSKQGDFTSCTAYNTNFSNFRYEVQMTIIKGRYGGITFRSDGSKGNFYYFRIGQDGAFALDISRNNNYFKTIQDGYSSAIKTGLFQSNLISVLANANNFDLYVNNQLLTSVSNNTYTEGKIGVIAVNKDGLTEVAFNNAEVWTI